MLVIQYKDWILIAVVSPCKFLKCHFILNLTCLGLLLQDKSNQYFDKSGFSELRTPRESQKGREKHVLLDH